MAEVRLFVGYPHPTDAAAFEKAYAEGHIPMAGPILAGAGPRRPSSRGRLIRLRASRTSIASPRFIPRFISHRSRR